MSIAIILEAARDFLRERLALPDDQCDIEPDGNPPNSAKQFFIGIDEGETRELGRDFHNESHSIEVWICREPNAYPERKRGDMLKKTDQYLANLRTMENLTRDVVRVLHSNYEFLIAVNTLAGVPTNESGDLFNSPLFYEGADKTEISLGGEGERAWHRRRLRFGGMTRLQTLAQYQ